MTTSPRSPCIVVAMLCCLLPVATSASAQTTPTEITPEVKQRVERCVTSAQEKWGVSGFDAYLTSVYHRRNQYDYRYVEVWGKARGTDEGWFTFEKCIRETFSNMMTGVSRWPAPILGTFSFFAEDPTPADPRGPKGK